jgi:hypothetical protein
MTCKSGAWLDSATDNGWLWSAFGWKLGRLPHPAQRCGRRWPAAATSASQRSCPRCCPPLYPCSASSGCKDRHKARSEDAHDVDNWAVSQTLSQVLCSKCALRMHSRKGHAASSLRSLRAHLGALAQVIEPWLQDEPTPSTSRVEVALADFRTVNDSVAAWTCTTAQQASVAVSRAVLICRMWRRKPSD